MPSPEEILEGVTRIANEHAFIAVLWHGMIAAALTALATGIYRPSRREGATLLALPLLSVSTFAFVAANPFNGTVFAVLTLALAIFGARLPREPARRGPPLLAALGLASIAFGFVYPHFLVDKPTWMYLVAAPVGLVPCPTLAVVLGFGLLAGGFGSRAWSLTAGVVGLFYAAFGVLRLGVWLDVGLAGAAVAMIACAIRLPRRRPAVHVLGRISDA